MGRKRLGGKVIYADGSEWDGEFIDNLMNGSSLLTLPDWTKLY